MSLLRRRGLGAASISGRSVRAIGGLTGTNRTGTDTDADADADKVLAHTGTGTGTGTGKVLAHTGTVKVLARTGTALTRAITVTVAITVGLSLALAGCTAATPKVITTPGPTTTNTIYSTATPAPITGSSPLTQAEAWDVCWGAQVRYETDDNVLNHTTGDEHSVTSTWNAYSPSLVTPLKTTGWHVILRAKSTSKQYLFCDVTGTAGRPYITDYLFQR